MLVQKVLQLLLNDCVKLKWGTGSQRITVLILQSSKMAS